jgi:hypothetical protein
VASGARSSARLRSGDELIRRYLARPIEQPIFGTAVFFDLEFFRGGMLGMKSAPAHGVLGVRTSATVPADIDGLHAAFRKKKRPTATRVYAVGPSEDASIAQGGIARSALPVSK